MIKVEFNNGRWEAIFPDNTTMTYDGNMSEMDVRALAREQWLAQRD